MRSILRLLRAALRLIDVSSQPKTSEAGQLAFATIADDPGLLFRLPRDQAGRLGTQAERFAASLLRDGAPSPASAHAVIRTVRQFTAHQSLRGDGVEDMVASALAGASDGLGGLLATIEREDGRLSQGTSDLAVDAVLRLGATGLRRVGPEKAETLMSAATRQAARLLRGETAGSPLPVAEGPDQVLRVVEEACASAHVLPLPPASSGRTRRERADALVELWRDTATCAQRGGRFARLWEDARDGHAFGAVWLMPSILSALLRTEADRLAGDARSAASYVVRRGPDTRGGGPAVEAARAVLVACSGAGSGEAGSGEAGSGEMITRREVRVRAAPA